MSDAIAVVKELRAINTRLRQLEAWLDRAERKVDGLGPRFEKLEELQSQGERLEGRLGRLEGKVDVIHRDLLNLRSEICSVIDPPRNHEGGIMAKDARRDDRTP